MLIDSKQLTIPGVNDEILQNITKDFSGFEKMNNNVGDNFPQRNPVLTDFLKLLQKNNENENIYYELQELEFQNLNRNYKPHLFTRKQEKNNQLRNAMFFLDSNNNPLEGNNLKEIWKLRFSFIEKMFANMKCHWVPSNLLYEINEQNQEIKLKAPEVLNSLVEKIINSEKGVDYLVPIREFSQLLTTFFEENKSKFLNFRNNAVILKITSNLSEIFHLSQKINFITFETVSIHYFEQIKTLILEINQTSQLLDKSIKKSLLKLINNKFKKKFSSLRRFYKFLTKNLTKSLSSSTLLKEIPSILKENQWIGKRLTNELIGQTETAKNINYELIDLGFYNDHSYHHYQQWKMLYQQLTDNNLLFVGPKVFSNVLFASNANSKVSDMVGAIPDPLKMRNVIKPLSYKLNWEREFYQLGSKMMNTEDKYDNLASQCQDKINKEMEFIVNLQNLKYVLKKNLSVDEIGQMLVDFKFVDELIEEHLEKHQQKFEVYGRKLKRKGKDFLKYLNHQFKGTYTNDYTKFMLKVSLRRDSLKEMVKMRNSLKIYKVNKKWKFKKEFGFFTGLQRRENRFADIEEFQGQVG